MKLTITDWNKLKEEQSNAITNWFATLDPATKRQYQTIGRYPVCMLYAYRDLQPNLEGYYKVHEKPRMNKFKRKRK